MSDYETACRWAEDLWLDDLPECVGREGASVCFNDGREIECPQMFADDIRDGRATVYVVVPMRLDNPCWAHMLSRAKVRYKDEYVEGIVTGMWPFDDRGGPNGHVPFYFDPETDYCVMITVKETE